MTRIGSRGLPAAEPGDLSSAKWSWACRHLRSGGFSEAYRLQKDASNPRPGDVALVRVEKLGHHRHLETMPERRLRLYHGDHLIGVFGNRYATGAYEGQALGLEDLHLLSGSGIIGTVISRHRSIGSPTALSFLGYLADSAARRVNLVDLRCRPCSSSPASAPVIAVIGTGMNTGKTTVTRKILRALVSAGLEVAGCKLTGTASPRDLHEMQSTGALFTTDFSEYGFPSTSGLPLEELLQLFTYMLTGCGLSEPQVVIMEIADGFLQPETQALLRSGEFRNQIRGVIVAGACSGSALCATDYIRRAGFDVWAVSGLITNSPLFMREFAENSPIPMVSSRSGGDWANLIMRRLGAPKSEEYRWETKASC
ncbi:MAG: hypothetical protein JO323_19145 [Acidobacteriia bacterium]|nr:hypothetical protein [Terriglobia bacterium]